MVLTLKRWKSRSSPGIVAGVSTVKKPIRMSEPSYRKVTLKGPSGPFCVSRLNTRGDAGWSSPVARQAHNLKVVGSNPTPATNIKPRLGGVFCVSYKGGEKQDARATRKR